ncbi:MAG: DUF2155 domain-containing protein [Parvibaculales bacterium]
MRKVLNNSVVLLVFMAMVAAAPVGAQIIDDKMMPPVLIMPPPDETGETEADDIIEDDDIIAPLSIMEVPVLDIVDEGEEEAALKPMLVGSFSLLHKVTAKVQKIDLLSGQEYAIGDMSLTMHDCISTPPEEPPETKAFLEISEFKAGRDKALFTGWMFASSPGINAMEHPVFDIWPLACKTEDGMVFTGVILPPVSETQGDIQTR